VSASKQQRPVFCWFTSFNGKKAVWKDVFFGSMPGCYRTGELAVGVSLLGKSNSSSSSSRGGGGGSHIIIFIQLRIAVTEAQGHFGNREKG
jgi:hypothetical protein